MKIIVLGSNGWMPSLNQNTSCFLLEYKDKLIILDGGTGISNLLTYQDILLKYKDIHIILSHYHLDHIIGLSYLSNFIDGQQLYIYGPGQPFYRGVKYILNEFTSSEFFARPMDKIVENISFIDYSLKGFYIDEIQININKQVHSNHSFGINIDNILHYATDTLVLEDTFKLAKDTELLLHECWNIDRTEDEHGSLEEILELQAKYKLKNIGLIHKNPNWDKEDINKLKSLLYNKQIFLVKDHQIISP